MKTQLFNDEVMSKPTKNLTIIDTVNLPGDILELSDNAAHIRDLNICLESSLYSINELEMIIRDNEISTESGVDAIIKDLGYKQEYELSTEGIKDIIEKSFIAIFKLIDMVIEAISNFFKKLITRLTPIKSIARSVNERALGYKKDGKTNNDPKDITDDVIKKFELKNTAYNGDAAINEDGYFSPEVFKNIISNEITVLKNINSSIRDMIKDNDFNIENFKSLFNSKNDIYRNFSKAVNDELYKELFNPIFEINEGDAEDYIRVTSMYTACSGITWLPLGSAIGSVFTSSKDTDFLEKKFGDSDKIVGLVRPFNLKNINALRDIKRIAPLTLEQIIQFTNIVGDMADVIKSTTAQNIAISKNIKKDLSNNLKRMKKETDDGEEKALLNYYMTIYKDLLNTLSSTSTTTAMNNVLSLLGALELCKLSLNQYSDNS